MHCFSIFGELDILSQIFVWIAVWLNQFSEEMFFSDMILSINFY